MSIQAVVDLLMANGTLSSHDPGSFTDRGGLKQSWFFSGTRGAALLSEVDAAAGGGEVQAWFAGEEVPCHNCHDYQEWGVLYYPGSGKVTVLDGHHGYDS